MSQKINKNEFSFCIPDYVFDLDLSVYAFRLYVHIKRQTDNGQPNTSGLRELAKLCKMSVDSVRTARYELVSAGLVDGREALLPSEARLVLIQKPPQGIAIALFKAQCEWCKCYTAVLHAHHYPTPRSEGGTATVNICPNCHSEYHALTRSTYTLKDTE